MSLELALHSREEQAKQSPEAFFMRYACPCTHNLRLMNSISEEEFENLQEIMHHGAVPGRAYLEKTFPAAFRRLKEVAQDLNIKDYWDMNVLKEYWHNRHNDYIDARDGKYAQLWEVSPTQCELCKVRVATVVDMRDRIYIVSYDEPANKQQDNKNKNPPKESKENNKSGKAEEKKKTIMPVVADNLPNAKKGDTIRIHSGWAVEFV